MNTFNGKPSVTPPTRYIAYDIEDAMTRDDLREYANRPHPTQAELEAACKAGRREAGIDALPDFVAAMGGTTPPLYLTPEELKMIDRALGFYSSDVCTSAEEANAADSLRRSLNGGNAV